MQPLTAKRTSLIYIFANLVADGALKVAAALSFILNQFLVVVGYLFHKFMSGCCFIDILSDLSSG